MTAEVETEKADPTGAAKTPCALSPTRLGGLDLQNRIVMAPLTRSRSDDAGVPPAFAADYYAQRASAGLIIAEATNISPQARGYAFTPGIWTAAQGEAWRAIVDAVHARGGLIFSQLYHGGRISHPDLHGGVLPVAPSAIAPGGQAFTNAGLKDFVTPRPLETDEMDGIVEDYRQAARNAQAAGFDGVEIHSANNYLLEQFIRDSTNRRTDRYGGSIENRLRLPLQVARTVADVWGAGRVGVRISPVTLQPGSAPLDSDPAATYGAYVDALSALSLLYVHCVGGGAHERQASAGVDFQALRRRFSSAWIANNEYDLETAEEALTCGDADLVSLGRPFLANPDLITRLRTGAPLAEAPRRYWYGGDSVGYSDWPAVAAQAS